MNSSHAASPARRRQLIKPVQMLKIKSSFFIIISSFLFSCAHSNKDLNCSDFRSGSFYSTLSKDGTSNNISRSDTIQREYSLTTGAIVWAKIKWITDCEYELQYIDELTTNQDTIAGHIKTHVLTNKILKTASGEINGTSYYYCVFESSMSGVIQKAHDTLWKHDTTD